MRRAALALIALALAGCASPEDRCIAAATAELRTVEGLIAETQATIARGYAVEQVTTVRERLLPCREEDGPFLFCLYPVTTVERRPVAINRAVERAKLASLQERRAELQAPTRAAIAACRAPG